MGNQYINFFIHIALYGVPGTYIATFHGQNCANRYVVQLRVIIATF